MNTAQSVLTLAQQELGYLEKKSAKSLDDKTANAGSGNFTKYWRDMRPSWQGQPWCACFIVWCFVKTFGEAIAKALLFMTGGYDYYTPTMAQRFFNAGQWFASPKVGDLIFFCSDSAKREGRWKGIHHIGIVCKVDSSRVYTYEGNTSTGNNQVIPNGGGVFMKSYSLGSSFIAGYARPAYSSDTLVEIPVECGREGLRIVGTDALNARKSPVDGAVVNTFKGGDTVHVTAKVFAGDKYWFKTTEGSYISGHYVQGWLYESTSTGRKRWWYIEEKYTYPSQCLRKIDDVWYAFDTHGWLIVKDDVAADGAITM